VIVCQRLAAGLWFSPGTPVSCTIKTGSHDRTEILLKVVLNTITLTLAYNTAISVDLIFSQKVIVVEHRQCSAETYS